MQCVFHSIRFKVNKGWSTAVLLFLYPYPNPVNLYPFILQTTPANPLLRQRYIKPQHRLMIKQDYLIRMIQEIISMIVDALLHRKRIREKDWEEYDHLTRQILGTDTRDLLNTTAEELTARYADTPDGMNKLELAAVSMLKLSEEVEKDNLLLKSRLRQEGAQLLKYIQQNSGNYSLQREFLIQLLQTNP